MKNKKIHNLKEMIINSATLYPDKDAYRIRVGKGNFKGITYRQLYNDMNKLGTALLNLGLKDKHIAVIGENSYEWCLSFLSIVNGVGVVVNLDKDLSLDELKVLINKGDIEAIIYSNSQRQKIKDIESSFPEIVLVNMDGSEKNQDTYTLDILKLEGKKLLNEGDDSYKNVKIDSEKFAVLLFTSGTSGHAKGVMLSHNNICSNIYNIQIERKSLDNTDIYLSILPIHHIYECSTVFLTSIYHGSTVYFSRGLKYIMEDLKEVKPTVIMVVPLLIETIYKQIMNKIKRDTKDLKKFTIALKTSKILSKISVNIQRRLFKDIISVFGGNLKKIFCGGAALNPEVAQFYRDIGIALYKGYGLTETAPLITGDTLKRFNSYSTGYTFLFIEINIDNPDEKGIGEIIVKGENIMLGYYKDIEATKEVLKDGWFYTGDVGYIDKNGCVYITGRKKNIIVLKSGKKITPEEIEERINNSPYIKESIVSGKLTKNGNDFEVVAQIVPDFEFLKSKNIPLEETQVIKEIIKKEVEMINKELAIYKHISNFKVRNEEFEKTTKRSIKRYKEEQSA